MLADATLILFGPQLNRYAWQRVGGRAASRWGRQNPPALVDRERLRDVYVALGLLALPLAVFFVLREPVAILSTAGIVLAAHVPLVAGVTLYLKRRTLPPPLRPGPVSFTATVLGGAFFAVFAVLYLLKTLDVVL